MCPLNFQKKHRFLKMQAVLWGSQNLSLLFSMASKVIVKIGFLIGVEVWQVLIKCFLWGTSRETPS